MSRKRTTYVSLFSGALGLDIGLHTAGFHPISFVECEPGAMATIKANLPYFGARKAQLLEVEMTAHNVRMITRKILKKHRLRRGEIDLLAGAPPCQPFSTAGRRKSFGDNRANGVAIFLKCVKLLRPRFFVIENVKGLLSAAKRHRPLAERGPGFDRLLRTEEHASGFKSILNQLEAFCRREGYCVTWGILNAADFGCPQSRQRTIFIGSRDGLSLWPDPTHSVGGRNGLLPWVTLKEGLKGLDDPSPVYAQLGSQAKEYLAKIPAGGNWRSLPADVWAKALGGAFNSWGGRCGFLRRLAWDKPAPTITNRPGAKATMLCHPTALRPLSVRECARLQQFPDTWCFKGKVAEQYKQIGNATPAALGHAIGRTLACANLHPKEVLCADGDLLRRLSRRPKTVLNPRRMRKIKSKRLAKEWLNGRFEKREDFSRYGIRPSIHFAIEGKTKGTVTKRGI